jgi:hypothetical protein
VLQERIGSSEDYIINIEQKVGNVGKGVENKRDKPLVEN